MTELAQKMMTEERSPFCDGSRDRDYKIIFALTYDGE